MMKISLNIDRYFDENDFVDDKMTNKDNGY
jgi:hypothetical protein